MANYKTHTKFNIYIALPLFIGSIYYFLNPPYHLLIIFSICFIYATLFMNPDLDVTNQIKLFSIRGLLTLPFRSYSILFSHRGLSHKFLIGSILRILWLSAFVYLTLYLLNKPFLHQKKLLALLKKDYFIYAFASIIAADFCHLFLDKIKSKLN